MRSFRLRLHGKEHIIKAYNRKEAIGKLMSATHSNPSYPPVEMKTTVRLRGGQLKIITATGANIVEAKAKLIAVLAGLV
jgi:hypothetical protein